MSVFVLYLAEKPLHLPVKKEFHWLHQAPPLSTPDAFESLSQTYDSGYRWAKKDATARAVRREFRCRISVFRVNGSLYVRFRVGGVVLRDMLDIQMQA